MKREPTIVRPDVRAYRGEVAAAPARARRPDNGVPPRPSQNGQPPAKAGGGDNAKLGEVARGSSLNLIGAGISALSTFAITFLVTRRFKGEVAGAFFAAQSMFLIVETLVTLGANNGLVYFIARLRALGEEKPIKGLIRTAVVAVMVVAGLAALVMFVYANQIAGLFKLGGLSKSGTGGAVTPAEVATALRALVVTMPFAALLDTLTGATRGYRQMRPTVVVNKISRSVVQMVGVGVAALLGSAFLLAPMWALPYVPSVIVVWLWLRRIRRRPTRRAPDAAAVPPELAALLALSTLVQGAAPSAPRTAGPRAGSRMKRRQLANANPAGFWRFTVPRAIASLAGIIVQRIGIVLVAVMVSTGQAAIFTAATRFLVAGQLGNTALINAAQPRFTEFFAQGDRKGANAVYQVTTAWLVTLTWPIYLLSVVYGPTLLALFGKGYTAGETVLVILNLTMLFAMACGQVDMVLVTTGRSSWSLINGLTTLGVCVGVDLWLIPSGNPHFNDVTGAAIGWAASILVGNIVPLAQLSATVRLHPFGKGTIVACVLSLVSFAVIPLAMRAALGSNLLAAGLSVLLGSAVFAVGLWRYREPLVLDAMPGMSQLSRRLRRLRRRVGMA